MSRPFVLWEIAGCIFRRSYQISRSISPECRVQQHGVMAVARVLGEGPSEIGSDIPGGGLLRTQILACLGVVL
jgi:hypothetical protein